MASGIEVGSAYLRIIPTTDGISQGIESSLTGGTVTAAAKKSGQSIGQSLSKGLTNVGGKLTKTITAPVVAFGTASGKMAVDFESSMAKVSTLVDTNSTDMGKMQKAIINVSKQYGVSASDVAEATYQAISAGQDAGDAVDFVNQSMGLAKAGFTDASTAVDTMTTVLNAYGMSADQASHVSDALITTQNLGKTTVDELGASMGKVIPTASMAGVNFDQLSAAFVTTTKNGIATAESTTYINGMLNELSASGTTASDTLKKKTGKSFKELMDGGASLTDVLGILEGAAKESGMSITDMFGSQEAGKAAATLTQHADDFNNAVKEIGSATDVTKNALDKLDSTNAEKLSKMWNELKLDAMEVGSTVMQNMMPVFERVGDAVGKAAEKFGELSPQTQDFIIKAAMVAAAIGPLLVGAGKVIDAIKSIKEGIGKIPQAIGLLKSPVALIVAGAVLAAILIITHIDTIKQWISTAADFIKGVWEGIKSVAIPIWEGIKLAITNPIEAAKRLVSLAVDGIKSFLNFTGLSSVVASVWNGIKSAITNPIDTAKSLVSKAVDGIKGFLNFSGALAKVQSVFNGIKSAITKPVEAARTTLKNIVDKIKGLFNFSWSFPRPKMPVIHVDGGEAPWGIMGKGRKPSFSVGWNAKAMNQPYMLDGATIFGMMGSTLLGGGEKGREMIYGHAQLMQDIRKASAGVGNVTFNMTINGADGQSTDELAEIVTDKMIAKMRRLAVM